MPGMIYSYDVNDTWFSFILYDDCRSNSSDLVYWIDDVVAFSYAHYIDGCGTVIAE